jgi:DNA-binding NarL/FixJ family response regulator
MPRRLTTTQREILKQLLAGMQNKQIAAELNLPEQTVKNGIRRVYTYLGITHTRELLPIVERARQEAARVGAVSDVLAT